MNKILIYKTTEDFPEENYNEKVNINEKKTPNSFERGVNRSD